MILFLEKILQQEQEEKINFKYFIKTIQNYA